MQATDTVSGILAARATPDERWTSVVSVSLALHAALLVAALVLPMVPDASHTPKTVMTISLGGAPGPRTGGMTPMGGREVQTVAPPQPRPRAETPPAPKPPEMSLPKPNARPLPQREAPPSRAQSASGRTLTAGEEVRQGSARADTGARGQGFGLTGGGGSSTGAYLDVGDFCCPDYLETVMQIIQRNWSSKQNVTGQTLVKFTIARNGQLSAVQVEKPSGFAALDMAAQRALLLTDKVLPLPPAFPNPDLTVHLRFDYQR